nr:unnamed protein product [Spirometra erinaceieuropaei]
MDYSEDYIYVWEVQAPPSRRITIRKNLLNLRADDQLRISEIIWNKTLALGNFSATAPEFKKITSLGNALRLELILGKSNSSSAMSSSSRSGRVAAAVGPLCYPASARCDGHYNCPDHSDELGCSADVCSLGSQRFLCDPLGPLGQCILLDNVCNSVPDCYNGADELEDLCLRNTSEAAGFLPEVARLIAQRVARQALETSLAVATSQLDSDLRRVLTYSLSALIAPLLSTLAFGFICRSHAVRTRRRLRRAPRFNSPILRLLREELRRRPPPPTYSEALDNSLFEEPILECAVASQSVPPLIPLSSTGLTRAQVESVRQRSMKPSNRVDVSCSCDLPSISDGLPCGDREHGQRQDEDEDDDDDDAGMDDSSEEDDEEEGGVVMGQADGDNLPAQVAGERGPVEPSQAPGESQSPSPPPPLPAAAASPACPSSVRSDGSGRLWQWINRLRRLGGAYQRIQAGASGGETSTSALVTAVTSGSDAPIGEFFSDAGSDLSRRQPPHHSVNPDEADAGLSLEPNQQPHSGA